MVTRREAMVPLLPGSPGKPRGFGAAASALGRQAVREAGDYVFDKTINVAKEQVNKRRSNERRSSKPSSKRPKARPDRSKPNKRRMNNPSTPWTQVDEPVDRTGQAFSVIKPGPEIVPWDEKDTSYYSNPNDFTEADITSAETCKNNARVQTKTVTVSSDDILHFGIYESSEMNKIVESAWNRILSEIKYEVNNATNGGTRLTMDYITKDKLTTYFRKLILAHHVLAEVNARQVWDPDPAEANPVMRLIAASMKTDTDLFARRDILQDTIANLALPRKLMDYLTFMWSPFKMSPAHGGTSMILISGHLLKDMIASSNETGGVKWSNTKLLMASLSNDFSTDTSIKEMSTISSLLMNKTGMDYIQMRNMRPPVDSPIYNEQWNTFLNNSPISCKTTVANNRIQGNWQLATNNDGYFATISDDSNISKFTSAHLLMQWGMAEAQTGKAGGFPFWNVSPNADSGEDLTSWYSDFIWTNSNMSSTDTRGYQCHNVSSGWYDRSNNNCILSREHAQRLYKPAALNVREYAPSFDSCSQACHDWLKHVFL